MRFGSISNSIMDQRGSSFKKYWVYWDLGLGTFLTTWALYRHTLPLIGSTAWELSPTVLPNIIDTLDSYYRESAGHAYSTIVWYIVLWANDLELGPNCRVFMNIYLRSLDDRKCRTFCSWQRPPSCGYILYWDSVTGCKGQGPRVLRQLESVIRRGLQSCRFCYSGLWEAQHGPNLERGGDISTNTPTW